MKVRKERYAPLAEVREILEKKEDEYNEAGREMLYEQRRALEHARAAYKLDLEDTSEMIEKLEDLEIDLSESQIIKIANLLPETVDDIRAIFAKERFRYSEEEIKGIIDIVDQYR